MLPQDQLPPLLECVANVSEGRDEALVTAFADTLRSVAGVKVLHIDSGVDANRTVFTFVGSPAQVGEAALRLGDHAIATIDLQQYGGTHPFVGALDVCPFVPLFGLPMEEAKQVAQHVGRTLARRHRLPVYFYEQSATRPEYRSLARVRKGGLRAITQRRRAPDGLGLGPDAGPEGIHPTAGASVVGARSLLVAYNINLNTNDVEVAAHLARHVRSSGKARRLLKIRAIGWHQAALGCAQVSINLTDYRITGLATVFQAIKEEAKALGHDTAGSELIGLVPREALLAVPIAFGEPERPEQEQLKRAVSLLGLDALAPFHLYERVLEDAVWQALRLDESVR